MKKDNYLGIIVVILLMLYIAFNGWFVYRLQHDLAGTQKAVLYLLKAKE